MNRIKKLRILALENTICYDEFFYKFYKCYADSQKTLKEDRYAEAFYFAFSNLTPSISEDELIVGKCNIKLTSDEECEWLNKYSPIAQEEAKKAGHHHFYLDMTHFWGLDEGWVSIDSRTAFHDRAIPTGVNEMYITPAYLYQQYLRDGGRQDHLQSEFIGIAGDTMPMTEKNIGLIVKDNHQLILILEEPTTVTALTAELSKLIIVKDDRLGPGYGSSVSSYCSHGPYKVTAVNPREIILQPNEAWKDELPYDVDQIRISPAA